MNKYFSKIVTDISPYISFQGGRNVIGLPENTKQAGTIILDKVEHKLCSTTRCLSSHILLKASCISQILKSTLFNEASLLLLLFLHLNVCKSHRPY